MLNYQKVMGNVGFTHGAMNHPQVWGLWTWKKYLEMGWLQMTPQWFCWLMDGWLLDLPHNIFFKKSVGSSQENKME